MSSKQPARHSDPERNRIINRTHIDLENIINSHDPEIHNLTNRIWDRLDLMGVQLETRNGWQPIKDAPKDGMTVDLWNSITEERRADARFINGKWSVWGQDGFETMGWVAAEHQDGFTHFMHIPVAPPSREGKP